MVARARSIGSFASDPWIRSDSQTPDLSFKRRPFHHLPQNVWLARRLFGPPNKQTSSSWGTLVSLQITYPPSRCSRPLQPSGLWGAFGRVVSTCRVLASSCRLSGGCWGVRTPPLLLWWCHVAASGGPQAARRLSLTRVFCLGVFYASSTCARTQVRGGVRSMPGLTAPIPSHKHSNQNTTTYRVVRRAQHTSFQALDISPLAAAAAVVWASARQPASQPSRRRSAGVPTSIHRKLASQPRR